MGARRPARVDPRSRARRDRGGLPAPLAPLPEARRAWATALALAWLETRAAAMADEWQWIAAKGTAWLEAFADGLAATGRGEASCGRDFRDAAREQLSRW